MRLATGKPLIFMCKANAYGHGLARVVSAVPAYGYGVATEEEGATVRTLTSSLILVTAPRISSIPLVAAHDLMPLVGEETYARALVSSGRVKRCHLKVNSGMNRLGFSSAEACFQIASYLVEHGVTVMGVGTHYKSGDDACVQTQNLHFDKCVHAIRQALFLRGQSLVPITHVTSCGAKFASIYDVLRVGLAAYGYAGAGASPAKLEKAMSVTSEILAVKGLKAGDTLGYGGIYAAEKDRTAYTVLGGYADGVARAEVGRNVWCKDAPCRIVAVCMDTFEMVSDGVDLRVGDRVIIMSEKVDADIVAASRGTIPYEVLLGYDTPRAERIYDG